MLEPPSQLLLKRLPELMEPEFILVNPPADALSAALQEAGHRVKVLTWNHEVATVAGSGPRVAVYVESWHEALQQGPGPAMPTPVVFMPKAAGRLPLLLHALLQAQFPARFSLTGETRSGVQSAARRLQKQGWQVTKLESARHCQWWSLAWEGAPQEASAMLASQWDEQCFVLPTLAGVQDSAAQTAAPCLIRTLPGVFSHGRLDDGTRLLIETLLPRARKIQGPLLDYGCGAGPILAALLLAVPELAGDGIEIDYLSLQCCARNMRALGIPEARWQLAHGSSLGGTDLGRSGYAMMVSNPPFHKERANDLSATSRFLAEAKRHLLPGGRLCLVANRFLPWPEVLRQHFRTVVELAGDNRFRILEAR